jgi:hypothetical protein
MPVLKVPIMTRLIRRTLAAENTIVVVFIKLVYLIMSCYVNLP